MLHGPEGCAVVSLHKGAIHFQVMLLLCLAAAVFAVGMVAALAVVDPPVAPATPPAQLALVSGRWVLGSVLAHVMHSVQLLLFLHLYEHKMCTI